MGSGVRVTRRELLVAAGASAAACGLAGAAPPIVRATPTSTRLHPTLTLLLRGIDTANGVIYASDIDTNTLRQSGDWAQTWSAAKGLPPGTTADQATTLLVYNDTLYCAARNGPSRSLAVYASPLASGDTAYSWQQTPLQTQPKTSAKPGAAITHDDQFLYAAEYGDPPNGPNVYRSADGSSWDVVFSQTDQMALIGRLCRHVHAVAVDPYNTGHVYITTGDFGIDTGAAVWRSTQHGDPGTWEVVVPTGRWQTSQISFDKDVIWLGLDNHTETAAVLDRVTGNVTTASPTHHYDIPVPGGKPGDAYFRIASHGCIDTTTGIYYCVADSDVGNTDGMFAIESIGSPVVLVDPGGIGIQMEGHVYLAAGRVWSGQWYRPLLAA